MKNNKKIRYNFIIVIMILVATIFCSCTKNENLTEAQTMEDSVAYEISQISDIDTYNDETIKALSVVIRTNLNNNSIQTPKFTNLTKINEKIYTLCGETKNQILTTKNKLISPTYSKSASSSEWNTEIKKSDILKFMVNKGISLSNISKIEPNLDENGNLNSLSIGGKEISYIELESNFNLKSSKIKSIEKTPSTINISGEQENIENCLILDEANKSGQSYDEILAEYFSDFDLVQLP